MKEKDDLQSAFPNNIIQEQVNTILNNVAIPESNNHQLKNSTSSNELRLD